MKVETDDNIWGSLENLSGRDKGHIYAQRAHYLIGAALNDTARYERLFINGRVRRSVLAAHIGCHRSALRENPKIAVLLDEVEGRETQDAQEIGVDADDPSPPQVVQFLMNRLCQDAHIVGRNSSDRIVHTDRTCRIDGRGYEIPTIIWADGIEPDASDWLRHLVITNAVAKTTASQYAKILRAFLRHCRKKRRAWSNVDDDFIRSWRDGRRGQVDDHQIISDLHIVFQFYAWAEATGLLSFHVGTYEKEELPSGLTQRDFPISARRKVSRKHGSHTGWVSTLTFRASKAIEGRRSTPNDEQVMSIHEHLLKATHGERDSLIAAWAEEAGPRRCEILQLRRSSLPNKEELSVLIAREEDAEIRVGRRKRGSKAPLRANPFLILTSLNWIEGGRRKIVEDCRKKIVGYCEPDEIFISSTTGQVLAPDSVTKIMSTAFKAAGVKKASLHRLRAKAIVEELERYVDAFLELNIVIEPDSQWAETVLVKVAEMAGHASPMSLRPYLNFVLHRRLSLTEADRRKRLAERTRDLERRAAAAKAELEQNENIVAAIRLFGAGEREAADKLLRKAVDGLLRGSREPERCFPALSD
jgi:integrase